MIDVIIPAFNAGATIGHSVATSLAQQEVASVIVVDDCSTDHTGEAALAAAAGDSRLRLERFSQNRGPAAARNHALGLAKAPYVAMVDSDDWVLPGRFKTLLAKAADWDFAGDNILFVPETIMAAPLPEAVLAAIPDKWRLLGLSEFVERNISKKGRKRSELGFLKPVFRRELLALHDLGYAENVRLGEDFVLYSKAMARGARFMLSQRCGYVAIERPASLSGLHRKSDLDALRTASIQLAIEIGLSPAERHLLADHAASISHKIAHREFLERKSAVGLVRAILEMAVLPRVLLRALTDILADKQAARGPESEPTWRLLLNSDDFS